MIKLVLSKKAIKQLKKQGIDTSNYLVDRYPGNMFLFKIKYYYNNMVDWFNKKGE